MAGRPKAMLRKVSKLTMRASALWNDIQKLMPEQYRDGSSLKYPLSHSWNDASMRVAAGYHGLNELGKQLAIKAKIIVEKDQLIEIDEESATLAEWSAEYGVPEQVILDRVRCGWDWETAVTKPATDDELRPEESVPEVMEVEG
jgi:hypothetical protein